MSGYFHLWLDWLPLFEDKKSTTIRAYSQGVRRVVAFADLDPSKFEPGSLDQATLTDTVRGMRTDEGAVSRATLTQTLAALKSFYDFCIADGLVSEVPNIARIRKVAKLDVAQVDPEYYRPDEIRSLFAEAAGGGGTEGRVRWPARDLAMCSFLTILGLRSAELASANIGWIRRESFAGEQVEHSASGSYILHVLGKGGRRRPLPLSSELVAVNERWQAERVERFGRVGGDDPLFVTNDGRRFEYQRLRYWLRHVNSAAGLSQRSLHALRHTAGVQLAADGVPMNVIQSLLGHASIATTGIYTELVGGELDGVLKKTDANTLLGEALLRGSGGGA